jgi:sulfopyruvate decarboxylase TPP-binding subunit
VLAPLLGALGPQLLTVSREENAVGVAAGTALAGCRPVVLMQNSGFGASLNAFASLIQPYGIQLLLVISLRGRAPDLTTENLLMGTLTVPVLDLLDIPHRTLTHDGLTEQVEWAVQTMTARRRAVALLVAPDLFAWSPA